MFRSSAFNPQSRAVDEKDFQRAYDLRELNLEDISLTYSTTRRSGKRPAIKSILEQRSPVLVSLFPNSKDSAPRLFDRRTPLSLTARKNGENEDDCYTTMDDVNLIDMRVGIIGENISGFNPNNLTPFGTESEKKTDDSE